MNVKWTQLKSRPYYGGEFHAYSTINNDGEQVADWGTCKDYVLERHIWANVKMKSLPYGTVYDPLKMPELTLDGTSILFSTDVDYNKILDLVNQIDEVLGMRPSTYERVESPWKSFQDTYWEGDPRYMHAPPLFGLWTMLLRNARIYKPGDSWQAALNSNRDYVWAPAIVNMINFVVAHGIDEVFGPDKSMNWGPLTPDSANHASGGPYLFATAQSRTNFRHWKFPKGYEL